MHNIHFGSTLKDKNLNYVYLAFDVSPENLKYVANGAKSLGIKGFNITIPYKVDIMNYLDKIDKEAELIGAVNTVKIENDIAIGYNTDGLGARMSLEEEIGKVEDKNILIIGAGGREYSIGLALKQDKNVERLYFAPGNGATDNLGKNLNINVGVISKPEIKYYPF